METFIVFENGVEVRRCGRDQILRVYAGDAQVERAVRSLLEGTMPCEAKLDGLVIMRQDVSDDAENF